MDRTYTEDEREAAVAIQSRFRNFQARVVLDKVMRGDRDHHAFQVFDAITSATKINAVPRELASLERYGMWACTRALSLANDSQLAARVGKVYGLAMANSTSLDMMLSTIAFGFMLALTAVIYHAPLIFGVLVRNIFETDEGSASFEQFLLWAVIAIGVGVLFWAVYNGTSMLPSKRVTRALKERFTLLTVNHSKMISRSEQETLAKSINSLGEAVYVLVPAIIMSVILMVASAAFVFSHSWRMGLYLVFAILVNVVAMLFGDMQRLTLAAHVSELNSLDELAWCDLQSTDEAKKAAAKKAVVLINDNKANKESSTTITLVTLWGAQVMATMTLLVLSLFSGLDAIRAGSSMEPHHLFYNVVYSMLSLSQLLAITQLVPALCAQMASAIRITAFFSMTSTVQTRSVAQPEYSYAVSKMSPKMKTPLAPLLFIVIAAAFAVGGVVRLLQTAAVACGPLEVKCTLMDGTMQKFSVAQAFDLAAGCVMPLSHKELVNKCFEATPNAVMRTQQHTCAIKDDELSVKFTWETAQGHTSGVTVGEPCLQLDLCANVSCPALDECHSEGKCVAGLCTTPAKADGSKCSTGVCAKGVCGSTAFVAAPILKAAATCQTDGGALTTDMKWMTSAITDRKAALANFRRSLAAPRRALSADSSNNQQASDCDPRKGVCPGYDQMFCNQPFALNYKDTAVYGTHCCSELNSMSVFFGTSSVQNKVMVKFHKLNGEKFDYQGGGVNYADPLCRSKEEVNMLTQHDFDTIAPMFDAGSVVDVDTRRYDAFGYPFGEKAMSAEFVLDNLAATGCSVPKARRLGTEGYSACTLFRGWKSYKCEGKKKGKGGSDAFAAAAAGAMEAASMLFGKFDFTEFGTSAYGSLASPLTAAAADFKAAPAAAGYDFGAQDYASVMMDFGDFQFLSLGKFEAEPPTAPPPSPPPPSVPETRRLEEKVDADAVPAVSAAVASAGFSPNRAQAAAKLAAAAQCPKAAIAKADLGDATEARVVEGKGDARALLAKTKEGNLAVVLRSGKMADAVSDDATVSLDACAECKVSKVVANEWASLRANLTAALAKSAQKVSIIGHGVGGAMATLAALDLAEAGVPVAELHTFGSPRVGNAAFADYYADSAPFPHHRVTHGRDPIPHTPSSASGFNHVGREIFFNKASSSYKVCKRGEDPTCSLSVVMATGVDDHVSYMGENFAAKYLQCMLAPQGSAGEVKAFATAAKELA